MRIGVGLNCLVKGLENQRNIIAFTEHVRHNTPIVDIQNGTRIEFVDSGFLMPLEFCHLSEAFLVRPCGIKLPVQKISSKILWVLCLPSAAVIVIFHGRAYISGPADAEHPLVIDDLNTRFLRGGRS